LEHAGYDIKLGSQILPFGGPVSPSCAPFLPSRFRAKFPIIGMAKTFDQAVLAEALIDF
jgi:hypothetical protein